MELSEEIRFDWAPMEEQPELLWATMEQLELSWAPEDQVVLADQQFRLASAAAIGLQMKDNLAHDDDVLQLLEEPRDEGDLNEWLAGDLHSSSSQETNVNHQMEGMRSNLGGTPSFPSKKRGSRKKSRSSMGTFTLSMKDNPAHDDDVLQLLEEPRDEGDLNEWLAGDLHSSSSQETNVNHQMEGMRISPGGTPSFSSKKRGSRKKRMSPWNPLFFERRRSASVTRACTPRKNNSRWTPEEVESLVQGISEYGIGKWTELKGKYFKRSIRTSVNLKDKWRNLLKAYDVQMISKSKKIKVQKTTLLHLEEPLIKRIKELAEKHRRACEATLSDSSSTTTTSSSSTSNTSNDSFLTF